MPGLFTSPNRNTGTAVQSQQHQHFSVNENLVLSCIAHLYMEIHNDLTETAALINVSKITAIKPLP